MKKKKIELLVLFGIFILSFLTFFMHGISFDDDGIDTRLLKTNDYYDEIPGIPIVGTTDNIFTLCKDNLYFYNSDNNGSIYRVNLNNQPFTPLLVRGGLGVVYDIDASYGPNGDMVFLATAEYNNAIMKFNTSILAYQKVISSTWIPQKLSVNFDYRFENMFIAWRTASNVFAWNSVYKILRNIGPDFFGVIDVQCDGYDVLYYNSEEILIYSTSSTIPATELKRIVDTGITSVFWDTSREYIIYAQDDDYDNNADGRIVQYNYFTDEIIYIQSDIDYPVSVWATSDYVYWLERGYWSSRSIIYRYSYYYDSPNIHYYSKVSRAHGVSFADRIEFQDEFTHHLGVYWGYNQLYVINRSDITPPDTIEWMNTQEIKIHDTWSVTWWNSYDLNGIEDYELIVSKADNFSISDTYWISESEEYSYTSLEFSNMGYGDYYYKVRTRDTMGLDPTEESNIGEWSDILHISYPAPIPVPTDNITIPSFNIMIIFLMILFVTRYKFKKTTNN